MPAGANKLLVLIGGRSACSPLYAGIFCDLLQVMLATIYRIEFIPGAVGTLWEASTVNVVINIITHNTRNTQVGVVDLKAGPVDQNNNIRCGGRFGDNGTYRVYGSGYGFGDGDRPNGGSAKDDGHSGQAGFRTDWSHGRDALTIEGDFFRDTANQDGRQYGADILGHWWRGFENGSGLGLQTSFDQQERVVPGSYYACAGYNLRAQQTIAIARHTVVGGGDDQIIRDHFVNDCGIVPLVLASETISIGDLFAEDTVAISDSLKLTCGTKFTYSNYAGFDHPPTVRLGWRVSDTAFLWAAVSGAVRMRLRLDRDVVESSVVFPSPNFQSEKPIAYEIGYRGRTTDRISLLVSLHDNSCTDQCTACLIPGITCLHLGNNLAGSTFGVAAWGDWQVRPWWRQSAGLDLPHKEFHLKSGVVDPPASQTVGNHPGYQASLHSSTDLAHNLEFDFVLRASDRLVDPPLSSYIQADALIGWHVTPAPEISLAGYDLLAPRQPEMPTAADLTYVPRRSADFGARWRY